VRLGGLEIRHGDGGSRLRTRHTWAIRSCRPHVSSRQDWETLWGVRWDDVR
jgi:hypothetical protein